ncbi:MAG: Peptidyl-tRNA hydrolase [Chlamydiales bacterium]|nr:Peptidyl-tRNA hydrolase [Chlamydiales bacterium]MCH9635919.1 Peptidyl-tRNA hydrolase [Chlamydiales bacterium]
MHLIVGLGNPGTKYEKTRHNLGYLVAEAFAKKHGGLFKRAWKVKGQLATAVYNEKRVAILLPTTYMNLSGEAVRRLVNYYRAQVGQLMVVVDEVYLKFGQLRIRKKGGSAGHNGMRSIEDELQTQDYQRLRMGVGPQGEILGALEDFVLEPFSRKESEYLDACVDRGVALLEKWLDDGIDDAIQAAGEYRPLIG